MRTVDKKFKNGTKKKKRQDLRSSSTLVKATVSPPAGHLVPIPFLWKRRVREVARGIESSSSGCVRSSGRDTGPEFKGKDNKTATGIC